MSRNKKRKLSRYILTIIIAVALISSLFVLPISATTVIDEDFEGTWAGDWDFATAGSGTYANESTIVHGGSNAFNISSQSADGDMAYIEYTGAASPNTTACTITIWIYLYNALSDDFGVMAPKFGEGATHDVWQPLLCLNGSWGMQVKDDNGATVYHYNETAPTFPQDEWFRLILVIASSYWYLYNGTTQLLNVSHTSGTEETLQQYRMGDSSSTTFRGEYIFDDFTMTDTVDHPTGIASNLTILGLEGTNKNVTWSGYNETTVYSNATAGAGGTLNMQFELNATSNLTQVRVYCDDLDATILASNIGIQFSSDNTTWGDPGNWRTFSNGGSNITINDAQWTTGNGCYGTDPFSGSGMTEGTHNIYAHFRLAIPAGASGGTYTQSDWKVWWYTETI